MTTSVLKEKYLEISLDEQEKVIELKWNGFVNSQNYRNALDKALDIAKENGITKWLTDARKVKVISLSDQEWVISDWVPRAVKCGYKYQAMIVPEDAFGKMSSDELVSEVEGKSIVAKNFTDKSNALTWLNSISK